MRRIFLSIFLVASVFNFSGCTTFGAAYAPAPGPNENESLLYIYIGLR